MISLFGSNVGKEELAAVQDCFERQWMGIGPKTAEFEKRIAEKCGVNDFIFLNSGSNSLQMALRLLNLPEGSEVILPSFTWIACANAIQLNNLKPIFCDVDLDSCNARPEDVERKITKNTSAIMVVHYAGKPVDMDGMKQFGLPIVEDAAHAIDSYYKGKHCGAIADVGIFSFDAVKNLTTAEGGGLLARDAELADKARQLRYCGIAKSGFQASGDKDRWWEYEIHDSFPKMLNTDVNASIGLAQLEKLKGFQQRRKDLWERYNKEFREESWADGWLKTPVDAASDEQHSYFTYCIQLRSGDRDKLAKHLYDDGIYTSLRFHPLHMNAIYGSTEEKLENCEVLNQTALNIPFHHRLSDDDVSKIFDSLKTFREKYI